MAPKAGKKVRGNGGGLRMSLAKRVTTKLATGNQKTRNKTRREEREKPSYLNESAFVNMVLDPCNSTLTKSPFGASEDAYIWRVNNRFTVSAAANGNLMVALYPLAICNYGVSTAPGLIQQFVGLSDTSTNVPATTVANAPAMVQFNSMAAQVRVTAGCIGLSYIGAAQSAAGRLFGWEGQGDQVFGQYSNTGTLQSSQSPASFANNGRVYPITSGVEALLNYSQAPSAQTQYVDPKVNRTDVYTPMAVVGVSGGAASATYEVTCTLVVEWVPLLTQGIPNANVELVKPGAAERIANALKMLSPMLVRAGKVALGGYAGALTPATQFGWQFAKALMA